MELGTKLETCYAQAKLQKEKCIPKNWNGENCKT